MISSKEIINHIASNAYLEQGTLDVLHKAAKTIDELRASNDRLRRENDALSLDLGLYENGYIQKKGLF